MSFLERIERFGIAYSRDVSLSQFSYMRTGGVADVVLFPADRTQLSECLKAISEFDLSFKVIGNTSNLLFLDGARYGCLLSTSRLVSIGIEDEGTIVAEAGVMMPDLSRFALQHSLTGMEGLEGIPGTVGGGIFMNAGAYGSEIRDTLVEVEAVDSQGNFRKYSLDEVGLTHRSSIFRKERADEFVFSCRFFLAKGDERRIFSRMELFHAKRHRYQDFMYPSLGSIFSGSPYRVLAKQDFRFGFAARIHMLLTLKDKLLGRESPINRRWLNDAAVKRFDWRFDKQPFSDKTINCLVNRGQGTDEMVRFIRLLEKMMKGEVPLENEIVEAFR
ncbi:FAD-binding protein [Azoarcus sp. L1K30]|uniref:UDP-N-acetylmuramate dehydrogenase n=1 Tax=Azoarcus sp. L1K30 TaxID=2820277 RepID=UPI001B82CD72|nr:FAD-binding protein [Azoarcus sp. L1K30]MBR0564508.1 FAD-binding protein [Azoarcus sp. L1K30]